MRRINFTGRKRILQDMVGLRVRSSGGEPVLDVLKLDLDSLSLPEDAPIFIEAYRRSKFQRISAGTVNEPVVSTGLRLPAFETAAEPLFRVKVIGVDEDRGKLLAVADQIRAEEEEEGPQKSLLSIAGQSLGQRVWRMDFRDDEPQLLVNLEVGDWKDFAAGPLFVSLVLPEALRQVVDWVIDDLEAVAEGDLTPRSMWISLLSEMGTDPREADLSEARERELFVDRVVQRFCEDHRFLDVVREEIEVGDQ